MSVHDPHPTAPLPHQPPGDPETAEAAPEPAPGPDGQPSAPRKRGTVAVLIATSTAFALVAALAGYLYWTTVQWQREATALDSRNAALEQQIAGLSSELDDTREELEAATDRLLELAGEHAQTADERELLRQLADRNAELADENAALAEQQNRIAVAAATAAARLSECAAGQHQLLELLLDDGDQGQIQDLIPAVNADCATAQQARDDLVRLLD